ncbi:hypothetical protein OGAPHI_004382 [Ogataea philodendri]|uniref:Vacuolar protein sorting-associated protein n=1 Tax=Ogataea philodendri TaxID=1378263 RepID=A0A9P8P630_9ASCO|nr:uncharacterized protein OGAPHI_004382 [Ogataea philodendri]KAH3666193.1 hypothetical protein OGAPHI_004382 [Ogataea philodendri]
MLESLVANILNRALGAYVENFDPKQLNIGIWSGDVKLKNLKLKKESLEKFELPVDVRFGHIGELTLQIPWSNLKSKPVKVLIDDVFLLASPRILTEFDAEEEKTRELRIKKEKLEALELVSKNTPYTEDEQAKNESFTESLVTKIVDNLQVTIKNIHFRYEDDHTFTENPYTLGFTLTELSAVSADENWIPGFNDGVTKLARKLLTLGSLSVYWDTENASTELTDHEELIDFFKTIIERNSQFNNDAQYILKPVSGFGHLTVNKQGATESSPHYAGKFFFDEFGLDLDSHQYRDALWTASHLSWYLRTQKFRKIRPRGTVEDDPKKWLQYAFNCVYTEIHEKNYKWTWEYFKKRRDQRKSYIGLWKQHLGEKMTPASQTELNELENELGYEDIKFYRSLARMEYRKENETASIIQPVAQKAQQGWFSWWGGGATEQSDQDSELTMSDEQRKEFYEAIEFDEKKKAADSIDIPRERVIMAISCNLKKGSFAIRNAKGQPNMAEIVFEGCDADFFQRKDSFFAGFKLNEFRVEDGSDNTLYKHIVSVKPLKSSVEDSGILSQDSMQEPFFQVSFENNPLDESADSALLAKMNSMTIFHNPKFIESIARFFTPPKIHLDTIGMLMNAAESTIQDFTKQTRIGLQYAFEEHKTINCKMDLQAPLIIVPVNPGSWSSPVAVLDAGHISIVSDLVSKDQINQIKAENKDNYTAEDWERMNSYLYDKFDLMLQDAQILIGSNIKSTIEQLHQTGDRPALILEEFSMKFLVELSIIPSYYNLPRIRVGGDVPQFRAMLSDYQYKVFMELIEVAIPNFNFEDEIADEGATDRFKSLITEQTLAGSIEELDGDTKTPNSESSSISTKVQPSLEMANKQHQIEFNFNMDLIYLSLNRCSNSETLESDRLVDLIGEKLRLKFFKTALDMHVHVLLEDLAIEDFIERSESAEFKSLVSSKLNKDAADKENLFEVHYSRTQRLVPFKGENIEVYDQKVDLDIADFKVVVTRKSLLTLLNFVLNTFTDPEAPETSADKLRHNNENEVATAPQHIDVQITLQSIILVLNDDGIKLATMTLQHADIQCFLLPEKMKVSAKIGGLSLFDEVNEGASKDSPLRQLITIRGDELAEFYYETFDAATNKEAYNTKITLKTGSVVVMFVEEPFTKIFTYLNQFQKMKYIYDRARETALSQANNIEDANLMKFDVLVRAPIFVFPKIVDPENDVYDDITANLGEIYAVNEFEKKDGSMLNLISTGLRNTKLTSSFSVNGKTQNLEIIDGLDVGFDINYCENLKLSRPTMIVTGGVTGKEMKLTEVQAKYLLQIFNQVPRVFSGGVNQSIEEIETDATKTSGNLLGSKPEPAVTTVETKPIEEVAPDKISFDVDFNIPLLALTIYNRTLDAPTLAGKSLSRFSLNDIGIKFEMKHNGNFKSDLHIRSFVIEDVRENKDNKFTNIIPPISPTDYQFMASVKSEVRDEKKVVDVNLAIDNPKVILALDYLFSLKEFMDYAVSTKEESHPDLQELEELSEDGSSVPEQVATTRQNETKPEESDMILQYSVNIVDPSVIVLANPQNEDSEAIVFKISQFIVTSQNILNVNAIGVGMFLCKMDAYETSRLRIVDDFSASFNLDSRGCTPTQFLSSIQMNIDPLLMRISLRDIRLALEIINKASAMYAKIQETAKVDEEASAAPGTKYVTFPDELGKKLSKYAPSILSSVSRSTHQTEIPSEEPLVIIKGEKMNANIAGLRLVVIGDVHELPVLDMEVKPFELVAKNWSTDLEADTTIKSLVNIFNYSTSSWEPLLEPWSFSAHVSKVTEPSPSFTVDIASRESAELTVTSRSIALLSNISSLITEEADFKPRGEDAPYRIINETGYDLQIWIDDGNPSLKDRQQLTLLKNGDTVPWSFEDWRKVRETLHVDTESNFIGVEIVGSSYSWVRRISLRTEGEEVFMLNPKLDAGYHNRLACEVVLEEDKVKKVYLKSTVTIQNFTQSAIHIGTIDSKTEGSVNNEIVIAAGGRQAYPLDYVYQGKLAVRPEVHDQSFGWSTAKVIGKNSHFGFDWREIMQNDMVLECPQQDDGVAKKYFFRAHATYNEKEALTQIYPHMTINVTPPLEIENLLPFDINWKVFQKGFKTWTGGLKKGATKSIHVVDMNAILMLHIRPLHSKYNESEAGFINIPNDSRIPLSRRLTLKSEDGQRLHLGLHYVNNERSGLKILIYAPYLVLNRTGKDISLSDRYNKMICEAHSPDNPEPTVPGLFSFDYDSSGDQRFMGGNLEENRAVLRIGDSQPSPNISIDKIGQSFEVKVPLKNRELENNVGIHITEGEGIYSLTKVISMIPRYVIRNNLDSAIQVSKVGASGVIHVEPGKFSPLYEMPRIDSKQLQIGFSGSKSTWSAPFGINDIGEIYVRVQKLNTNAHKLVRAVISTESAAIFIDILDAKDLWPYSIRNFSDYEFFIYQSDPNIDEEGRKVSQTPFKPIFYRIPPKSAMPYAWDFPAAKYKELVLKSGSRERFVHLAEIGTLMPMKIGKGPDNTTRIVDLNVVADGTIQSLIISNYDAKTSLYQLKYNGSSQTNVGSTANADKFETIEKDENYYTKVLVRFEGLGVSLINMKHQELCYTTIRGMELRYNESDIYQNLSLKLKWIQVDNQLYPSIYPIIVYPTVVPKSSTEMSNHPAFSMSISRLKDETHGVNYIKYATMLLQEMSIEVDEDFLFALLDFSKFPGASWNKSVRNVLWDENLQIPEPPTVRSGNDLYFEVLHLQPLQFNLSFVRTERINAQDTAEAQNALAVMLNILTMAIGNINDAPVRLGSLFLENIRTPLPYLIQNISEHYQQAFLYQLYKVLGSADVLGNPVGLFNNISSGVMDIFYEPYQGFIMTDRPQELGIGLAKGGLSFVKKSVYGFSDSFARFTGSMAKGMTAATMDKNFQERRRLMRQRNKPKHPIYGFTSGATSLVEGISSGISGIATAPIEGANQEGTAGFFKGLGKGLIGLPTKTATGLFDFANNISEGIRNTATAFDGEGLDKVRLPRFINYDGSLKPYQERESQGQFWLKSCEGGKYFDDKYLAHVILPGQEHCVIVSMKRIIIVSIVKMSVEWEILYDQIGSIRLENSGIRIKQKRSMGVERFIPIPDPADKKFLYSKIAVAVEDFNKSCIVAL